MATQKKESRTTPLEGSESSSQTAEPLERESGCVFRMKLPLLLFVAAAFLRAADGAGIAATYQSGMVCMVDATPTVHTFPHPLADLHHLPCEDSVVQGHYNDTIAANGWSFLTLEGNSKHTDEDIAAAAGLLEGSLTARRIAQHIANIRGSATGFPALMTAFVEENFGWMEAQAAEHGESDGYWHQVKLLLLQLRGMYEGVNSTLSRDASGAAPPTWRLFYSMALLGDQDDLCPAFGGCSGREGRGLKEKGDSHCRCCARVACVR